MSVSMISLLLVIIVFLVLLSHSQKLSNFYFFYFLFLSGIYLSFIIFTLIITYVFINSIFPLENSHEYKGFYSLFLYCRSLPHYFILILYLHISILLLYALLLGTYYSTHSLLCNMLYSYIYLYGTKFYYHSSFHILFSLIFILIPTVFLH